MKRVCVALALCVLAGCTPKPKDAFAACKVEDATYTMLDRNAKFTAAFRKRGDVLDLRVGSEKTGHVYWFEFNQGNGNSHISVIAITDPRDGPVRELPLDHKEQTDTLVTDIAFYALRHDLRVLPEPPKPGEHAPELLFIPELGAALWYDGEMLTEHPLPNTKREDMPRAMFGLTSCGK